MLGLACLPGAPVQWAAVQLVLEAWSEVHASDLTSEHNALLRCEERDAHPCAQLLVAAVGA